MPKLKVTDDELDIDALEEAEYSEGEFEDYDGPEPPKGTILAGYIKKSWWTYTNNDDPMIKTLFVADGNEGDREKFNGCPVWDNLALSPGAKFRWKPFIDVMGITLRDIKTKTVIASEDDNVGAPIEKIGAWEPGSEDAWCRIVTGREKWDGVWRIKASRYLPYEPEEEADEEPEEEEPEEVDEVEEELDEEEEEEEEQKPAAKGRRAAPARGARTASKPSAPARGSSATRTTARGGRAASSATRSGKTAAAKATAKPTRGRRSAATADDEPPF